jgi:hypothetical protein
MYVNIPVVNRRVLYWQTQTRSLFTETAAQGIRYMECMT